MYKIRQKRFWLDRNKKQFSDVLNGNGEVLLFPNIESAKGWIKLSDESMYELAHGEYSRPLYRIYKMED